MSYCRWSSDDFRCDVYCYADCGGGWTTHVANNRVIYAEPLPPPIEFTDANIEAWFERNRKVMEIVGRSEHVKIGLPSDGMTFNDPTPKAAAERLLALRAEGYNVPQHAIDALLEKGEDDDQTVRA